MKFVIPPKRQKKPGLSRVFLSLLQEALGLFVSYKGTMSKI